MIALIALSLVWQPSSCGPEGTARMAAAARRVEAFDLSRAAEMYAAAAGFGCVSAEVAAHYLRGLSAARDAYRAGGSPESLQPVRAAIASLDALGGGGPGAAQIARFVLLAAAAAAQSERDEMGLLIDHATRLESLQLAASQPGAPAVSAHEVAGDLWLQVHRYEDAQLAYERARDAIGQTPRSTLGLARSASRLNDAARACREYAALVTWWGSRPGEPREIREARAYVASACGQ